MNFVYECHVPDFHAATDILFTNPDRCHDCDSCVAAGPMEAFLAEDDVPEDQQEWIAINLTAEEFPVIEVAKDALKGPKCVNPNAA